MASALFSVLGSGNSVLRGDGSSNTGRPLATNSSTRATRAPTEVLDDSSSEEESDEPPPLEQNLARPSNNPPRSRATELNAETDSDSDDPPPLVSLRHTNATVRHSNSSDEDLPALEPIPSTSRVTNPASNHIPQPQYRLGDLRLDNDDDEDEDDLWMEDDDELPLPPFVVPSQSRAASNRYRGGGAGPHAVHLHRRRDESQGWLDAFDLFQNVPSESLPGPSDVTPPLRRTTNSIFGLPLEFSMVSSTLGLSRWVYATLTQKTESTLFQGEDGQTYISFNVGQWTAMPGESVERTRNPARARVLLNGFPPVPSDLVERLEALEKSGQAERDSEEDIIGGGGCSICYEPYTHSDHDVGSQEDDDTAVLALPCCHVFHRRCLRPWFEIRTTCPHCRFDIDPRSITFPASDSHTPSASQQRVLSWTPSEGKSLRLWIEQREQRLSMEQLSATFGPGGDLDGVD